MKNEVHPGVIVATGVVIVLIIGFFVIKQFFGNPADSSITPQQSTEVKQMRSKAMAQGVHRGPDGHFIDADGKPVDLNPVKQ